MNCVRSSTVRPIAFSTQVLISRGTVFTSACRSSWHSRRVEIRCCLEYLLKRYATLPRITICDAVSLLRFAMAISSLDLAPGKSKISRVSRNGFSFSRFCLWEGTAGLAIVNPTSIAKAQNALFSMWFISWSLSVSTFMKGSLAFSIVKEPLPPEIFSTLKSSKIRSTWSIVPLLFSRALILM